MGGIVKLNNFTKLAYSSQYQLRKDFNHGIIILCKSVKGDFIMKEIWKDIVGYEGRYQVSDQGRVKSLARQDRNGHFRDERILNQQKRNRGYMCVHLSKDSNTKWFLVHRLVASAFVPQSEGNEIVNHIDNNPSNNKASNLEWTTYKGNMQWASKQKRMKPNYSNLKKAQESKKVPVIAISSTGQRQWFPSQVEASRQLGVNSAHIAAACRKEYGYKKLGGYSFEYADNERNAKAKPNKVGKSKDELKEFHRNRMKGNTLMNGKHLSNDTKQKLSEVMGRKVIQLTLGGEVVAEYVSAKEASRITGIAHIDDVANGKRKTAGKYYWKWSNDL